MRALAASTILATFDSDPARIGGLDLLLLRN
jgi:hypothetical protein